MKFKERMYANVELLCAHDKTSKATTGVEERIYLIPVTHGLWTKKVTWAMSSVSWDVRGKTKVKERRKKERLLVCIRHDQHLAKFVSLDFVSGWNSPSHPSESEGDKGHKPIKYKMPHRRRWELQTRACCQVESTTNTMPLMVTSDNRS